jgi:hypothetical protein
LPFPLPAIYAAPSEDATEHCGATLLGTALYEPDWCGSGAVKSVGYLWSGHRRTKGKNENAVLQRLVDLAQKPLLFACGYHQCNLGICSFGRPLGNQFLNSEDGASISDLWKFPSGP